MQSTDGWVKTEKGWRKTYTEPPKPVRLGNMPCPRIATDTMDPTEHVDGKFYDSKSAYRAVTKREGYIEIGNDPARLRPRQEAKRDTRKIDAALAKAVADVTA